MQISNLIKNLESADSNVRLDAALELCHHPSEATIKALIKTLKDSDPDVRSCAAESLRLLGDPMAVEPLIEVLKTDIEHKPVYSAIKALGQLRASKAIEALISALEQRKDNVTGSLSELALQLGETRAKGAVNALIKLLEDGTGYQRIHAAMALAKIGDRAAVEPLKKVFNDTADDAVREKVEQALQSFR